MVTAAVIMNPLKAGVLFKASVENLCDESSPVAWVFSPRGMLMPNRHWNEGMSRLGAGFIGAWALFAAPAGAAVDERQQQLSEWRVACATGDGAACYALGEAYQMRKDLWGRTVKGDGVYRNDEQANRYFWLSCEYGFGQGCLSLGRAYERGARKDAAEAAKAYGKACALMGGDACVGVDAAPAQRPKLRS